MELTGLKEMGLYVVTVVEAKFKSLDGVPGNSVQYGHFLGHIMVE